jgi:3,4-dihydroxy 2-butanone 4-phosphate synthase/GTP cyclohydrolase II
LLTKYQTDAADSTPKHSTPDLRTYGVGAQILRDLGIAKMKLLGSPRRMPSMIGYGLEVTGFQVADDPS